MKTKTKKLELSVVIPVLNEEQNIKELAYEIDKALKNFSHEIISTNKLEKKSFAIDEQLYKILIDIRKSISKDLNIPPFAIFQESSIEEMTLKYPISQEELSTISGVGEVKAKKFGDKFIDVINKYVDENDIERPYDTIIKSSGINSSLKLFFIQSVDKKLNIEEMASAKNVEYNQVLKDLETIIYSGTKLNLRYIIDDLFDDESHDELLDFFNDLDSDDIQIVLDEFQNEYEEEDLKLFRLYHYCEIGF